MGMFVSTFIPYDATGRAVNLNTEYMYRCDGLRLNVIRFEYYKSDDADYNWFVLAPIDCNNDIRAERYKVSDLYVECPTTVSKPSVINDFHDLQHKLNNLICSLGCDRDLYDILRVYALTELDIEPANFIGYDARTSLRIILVHLRGDLYDVFEKIEDINA